MQEENAETSEDQPSEDDCMTSHRRRTSMSETPETDIAESDPNADSPEGLAGDMGVSSERTGTVRGEDEEVTYATAPTHLDDAPEDDPARAVGLRRPAGGQPGLTRAHVSDPASNPRHGV